LTQLGFANKRWCDSLRVYAESSDDYTRRFHGDRLAAGSSVQHLSGLYDMRKRVFPFEIGRGQTRLLHECPTRLVRRGVGLLAVF
jgi:hypothetical protein